MKSLLIREINEETLASLKRRAARHRRSLQKEIQVLLEEASRMQAVDGEDSPRMRLHTVSTGNKGKWSREEIYGEDGR